MAVTCRNSLTGERRSFEGRGCPPGWEPVFRVEVEKVLTDNWLALIILLIALIVLSQIGGRKK